MNIKEQLLSIEGNAHYVFRYHKFIEWCRDTNASQDYGYTEKHHILPKSIFPDHIKDDWNLVVLTARQHLIAHWMLAKAYGGGMWYALKMMSQCDQDGRRDYIITPRLYEQIREEHSKVVSEQFSGEGNPWYGKDRSGENNPMFGRQHRGESKQAISQKAKERFTDEDYRIRYVGENNPMFGKTHDSDARRRISESHTGRSRVFSEEHKKRISEAKKGKFPDAFKSTIGNRKGEKNTEEHKNAISEARKNMRRVYKENGKYMMVHKDEIDTYYERDGKYYDYPVSD